MSFKEDIKLVLDDVIEFRRDLHINPERSYHEVRTSKRVAEELEKLGIEYETDIGGYGVVGLIKGDSEGKTILLRADMDALPIHEENDLPFCSTVDGVMHACGHDVHTAMLLGAAKVLVNHKDKIKGNIKLCFQPAEEYSPTGGSQYMIDDGVLENPKVDAAVALHVWNFPVGTVALRDGTMMAQSDRLNIKVKGKSSHASQPQNGIDAIVGAAHVLTALQTVISRNTDAMDSAVISLGTIRGGEVYNIVCDEVTLEGTVRIFSEEVARNIKPQIERVVTNVAAGLGCTAECEYTSGYAMTVNDHELFTNAIPVLEEKLGAENVIIPERPASGGEDFSAFGKYVPSLFIWLGMESDKNEGRRTLHNPNLIVDEDCIPVGIETLIEVALDFLNK
ncbi:MAG: amidohydrolase [Tissierellia bacterium]|nr:amidohydrolase [Tissierellia bacterium]